MVRAFKNKIKLVYHVNVQVLLFYLLSSFSADVIRVVFGNVLCGGNVNIVLSFSCNVRRCSSVFFIYITIIIINHLTTTIISVLSLTQMLDFLSLYVMLSILLSILVCVAASLFCACLVSVQLSAP